jgi:thiol-disulfide isomerase/thioredoxin
MNTVKQNRFLRKKTLKNFKKKPKIIIGLIYANWCGHCQSLRPEWKNMKNKIKSSKTSHKTHFIEIEDSDVKKDSKLNKINIHLKKEPKLSVNGYPTIFKVSGGNLEYYKGERSADKIGQWVHNKQENQPQQQNNKLMGMFGGDCGCNSQSLLKPFS